jgi:hypothetical protein
VTLSPNERRLVESVAVLRRELEDRKQRRSTEGPPVVVRALRGSGPGGEAVVADAALSVIPPRELAEEAVCDADLATETIADPVFTYDDPDRGYDRGEWEHSP